MAPEEDETTTAGAVRRGTGVVGQGGGKSAQLVAFVGQELGRRYRVGAQATIGRALDADVRIEDLQVSRFHARIQRNVDGSYVIEDLGSHNGTLVNGKAVDIRALEFGDRIQLGPEVSFLFLQDNPLQAELLHRQKMEALGRVGASVAHDFSNLLAAALAGLEHLADLPEETSLGDVDVASCLEVVRGATARAQELAQRLLGVARRSPQTYEHVLVGALVREALSLVTGSITEKHRVEIHVPAELTMHANQAQLLQIVLNLVLNALDAMPEGGELVVAAERREAEELAAVPLHSPGSHVVLTVSDTGEGMTEEVQERVFEPFFSAKRGVRGAGLGLATVYEMARAHGGHAAVESAVGEGSTFAVYLPVGPTSDSQRAREPTGAPATRLRPVRFREGERPLILVADDEEAVRVEAGRILRAAGYDTLYVADGKEALEAYGAAKQRPALVLLDVHMPALDGEGTLLELRRMDSQVRVVAMSAGADEALIRRMRGLGALAFVGKPFAEADFLEAVQRALLVPASLPPVPGVPAPAPSTGD